MSTNCTDVAERPATTETVGAKIYTATMYKARRGASQKERLSTNAKADGATHTGGIYT